MNYSGDVEKASSTTKSLPMDSFLAASNLVCNLIGLPLNLLTAAYIIFKRRLHKTRNILWLGVAFSNVLILLHHLVDAYVHHFQSETAKKIVSYTASLPLISLMLNFFISLVDRYACIVHSAWYKRNIKITWVISGQIGCFSIICLLMKGPLFIEIFVFSSQFTTAQLKITNIVGHTTLFLCVVGYILVNFKVKYYLRLEKNANMMRAIRSRAFTRKEQSTQTTEFFGREPLEDSLIRFHHKETTAPVQELVVTPSPFFIHIGAQQISRRELEASRSALDSVTLFFLFALPFIVTFNLTIYFDCFPAITATATFPIDQHCSKYLWALAYTKGLMLIYPVVNPILFTTRSRDLSQALSRSG